MDREADPPPKKELLGFELPLKVFLKMIITVSLKP
jgi:hypothetical protein